MDKKRIRSSLHTRLKTEGEVDSAQTQAIKAAVAWQLSTAMRQQALSKARLAVLLKTSRSQVDRLLDPRQDVTLSTLQRVAVLIGRKLHIELV